MTVNDEAFEPTEAELVILNASDREIEAMQAATKLELLNLQVAEKAGWTDIKIWNPHAIKKSYVGVNLAHPELGIHIPNYVESVDAIAPLLERLKIYPVIDFTNDCVYYLGKDEFTFNFSEGFKVALSLCKLLLAINPPPITPRRQVEVKVIDDEGEIESQVLEATFGS